MWREGECSIYNKRKKLVICNIKGNVQMKVAKVNYRSTMVCINTTVKVYGDFRV